MARTSSAWRLPHSASSRRWKVRRRSLIPVCVLAASAQNSTPHTLRASRPSPHLCVPLCIPQYAGDPGPFRMRCARLTESTQRSDMGSKSTSAVAHGVAHQGDRLTSMSHLGSALPIMLRAALGSGPGPAYRRPCRARCGACGNGAPPAAPSSPLSGRESPQAVLGGTCGIAPRTRPQQAYMSGCQQRWSANAPEHVERPPPHPSPTGSSDKGKGERDLATMRAACTARSFGVQNTPPSLCNSNPHATISNDGESCHD